MENTLPTINETVTQALRNSGLSNYERQATPVVQALIEREQRIYTGVVEAGVSAGMNRQNIETLLSDLGMASPPVEMTEAQSITPQSTGDPAQRLARIEEWARANGYNG